VEATQNLKKKKQTTKLFLKRNVKTYEILEPAKQPPR
jgi:hypothetical protein